VSINKQEILINYLDDIYALMGQFSNMLDTLKLLFDGKIDKIEDITHSLNMVQKNIENMINHLEIGSDFMEQSLQEADEVGIKTKKKIYNENKILLEVNSNMIKSLKDVIDIVSTCNAYVYLILDTRSSEALRALPKRAITLVEEKSADEIFEQLMMDIKSSILNLNEIAKDILVLNNK